MRALDDKTFKQRMILWTNKILFDFKIKRKDFFFTFIIPEKYKSIVKTLKIALTLISLFSAFFVFQSVFIAFLFGLAVFLITSVLEKVIFTYSSLFVHPLPTFEIESEKWLSVFWGFAKEPNGNYEIPLIGMHFADEDYARKIYSLILKWTFGKVKDEEKNVKMSAILTDENSYVFFCYPNFDRETARRFYKEIEEEEKKQESHGDLHNRMAMMLVLSKSFDILDGSYFPTFRRRYKDGVPYLFQFGVTGEDGAIRQAEGTENLALFNLKIMDRRDLTRKDLEYDFLRMFE